MSQEGVSQRKVMEDAFISRMKAMTTDCEGLQLDTDSIVRKMEKTGKYYTQVGDIYIIDEISSNTYYLKKGGGFRPLCDKQFPKETIANRLLLSNIDLPSGTMALKFQKYRYETDSIDISFRQFVTFFKKEGFNAYVGIESMDKKDIYVDVYLYNVEEKWLHLINVTCPTNKVSSDGLVVNAKAWLFIPTSNLRDLMGKELPSDFMDRLNKMKK